MRRKCKKVKIGSLYIGGEEKVLVQSMLNVIADDVKGNIKQAKKLKRKYQWNQNL